jgi:hypothetical protein
VEVEGAVSMGGCGVLTGFTVSAILGIWGGSEEDGDN